MQRTQNAAAFSRRSLLKIAGASAALTLAAAQPAGALVNSNQTGSSPMQLTSNWDKTFPKSDKVDHQKVTFKNRYGITLVGDLYLPKSRANRRLPALAVGGPFGAVKEQSSGLYAQTMAERGFVTLAFDPSYTGESGGEPRNVASPDINTEDFSAVVDYLGRHPSVDRERIGVLGICGWGGMALNAVAVDKRVKAVAVSTMYDMTRVMSRGYNDSVTLEQRTKTLEQLSRQRWDDAAKDTPAYGPLMNELKGGEAQFLVDYHDYYKTARGFHPRSVNSNGSWTVTNPLSFMVGQLERLVDGHQPAVVHEHADPELHQGDIAAARPANPWRKGPLALLQRDRLRGRGTAEGTRHHSGR
jgi:uncharacterized protein